MLPKENGEKTYSTRASQQLGEEAEAYLAEYGITLSEYLRACIEKAANHEVEYINFLDTTEAQAAKNEAESGEGETFNSLEELWKDLNE